MTHVIRNGKLEIIGYCEISDSREVLRDRDGKRVGVYERDTKVTRDRYGKIVGLHINQLLRLL